jgi:uncharacterized RDD family membrane protein YckC
MFCTRCGTSNAAPAQFCVSCGGPLESSPAGFAPAAPALRYAGFWLRLWAYLIDGLILSAIPILAGLIIAPLYFTGFTVVPALGLTIFLLPLFLAEGWLYYAFMESSSYQATVGKRILSLKVIGMSRERISFGRATGRYFGKILSAMILHIGFIMAAFTEKKQALHDILASCLVIRDERTVSAGSSKPVP